MSSFSTSHFSFCTISRNPPFRSNGSGQLELAKAWVGVDVNSWYKHIAYQAAVCALLNTAMKTRLLPFGECSTELSLVRKLLSPRITMIFEHIDGQLAIRNPRLAYWFKTVKLPLLEAQISSIVNTRHAEEESKSTRTSSGVAVIIRAICCCVAIRNLGAPRVSFPMLTLNIPQIVGKLMDSVHKLVGIDKLHSLACKAGFEQEFLSHFGAKIVLNKTNQDAVFWITLVHEKLVAAFHRESVISEIQGIHNTMDLETGLASLGLFACLGRSTRLFLSGMVIEDLDEEVQDFLSYLECGGVLIYPELSSLPIFQLFMEVVVEECGWVNFYSTIPYTDLNDRRRSKQHTIQAEKEIILSAVFTTCSDVFSAFEHYQTSTRHSFNIKIAAYFEQSQVLLSVCLEDYWAAYYKSGELLQSAERSFPDPVSPPTNPHTTEESVYSIVLREIVDFFIPGYNYNNIVAQTIKDIMKGTQLLFMDISMSFGLLFKCIYSGHNLTELQTKKLSQTIADFGAVIPITILMLIPVSVVGHAAILTAIKKYIPSLIPSPYSSERLGMVKQLNRIKKMETETWMNNSKHQNSFQRVLRKRKKSSFMLHAVATLMSSFHVWVI
ncbi:hypothetical protein C5167_029619 [Papaver somniferum]|nr:hypothetical protein C5167_029619 [Papaver somniferum]